MAGAQGSAATLSLLKNVFGVQIGPDAVFGRDNSYGAKISRRARQF
jgi:hypothetical protein